MTLARSGRRAAQKPMSVPSTEEIAKEMRIEYSVTQRLDQKSGVTKSTAKFTQTLLKSGRRSGETCPGPLP